MSTAAEFLVSVFSCAVIWPRTLNLPSDRLLGLLWLLVYGQTFTLAVEFDVKD